MGGGSQIKIIFQIKKIRGQHRSFLRIWRRMLGGGRRYDNCLKMKKYDWFLFCKHPRKTQKLHRLCLTVRHSARNLVYFLGFSVPFSLEPTGSMCILESEHYKLWSLTLWLNPRSMARGSFLRELSPRLTLRPCLQRGRSAGLTARLCPQVGRANESAYQKFRFWN